MDEQNINTLNQSDDLSSDISNLTNNENNFFELIKPTSLRTEFLTCPTLKPVSSFPLILGLLGFIGILIPFIGYFICTTGIIVSSNDKKQINSKYGSVGFILSIIALVLSILRHFINIFLMTIFS